MCLDLETGHRIVITDTDLDVAARKLAVDEFPPALRDAGPRDERGRLITSGLRDDARAQVGPGELRRIARARLDLQGRQMSLFG